MSQRWSGRVKARDFVFAIRDHFHGKFHGPKESRNDVALVPTPELSSSDQDAWTLKCMDFTRVQAIIEAFDDEVVSSGYISVAEVNAFTARPRPKGWR